MALDAEDIDAYLANLSVSLFKVNEQFGMTMKLRRHRCHAAWISNKENFIESAKSIHGLADIIIEHIEAHEA